MCVACFVRFIILNFEAITNLMHICLYSYNITILYMFSSIIMLIFRRSNCICTASDTVTLYERPYVTLVKRELVYNLTS